MTRQAYVIAAALLFLSVSSSNAAEVQPSGEVDRLGSVPGSQEATGFDGFLTTKLAQLAATLNAERGNLGLQLDGSAMDSLLAYVSRGDDRIDGRIDRVKRSSVGLRFNGGEPEKERELELRFPLSGGAAVVSGYEASRLDLGLTSTDGDVAHEFKIGASLRF